MYTVETGSGELIYIGTKLMPPRAARPDIVESAHQGHFSPDSIYKNLRKYYNWPHMREFVEAKASKCDKCRVHKKSKPRQQPFVPIELQALEPGECWSVDIMTIGKMDFLVSVDRISQYLLLAKLPNKTAKACTKALKSWACLLEIPTLIKSDGGPAFDSKLFDDFCKDLRVVHILTSACNPQSKGQCERKVQEVKKYMQKSGER